MHIQYSDICDTYGMHKVFLHMLKVYPEFCQEKSMLNKFEAWLPMFGAAAACFVGVVVVFVAIVLVAAC